MLESIAKFSNDAGVCTLSVREYQHAFRIPLLMERDPKH